MGSVPKDERTPTSRFQVLARAPRGLAAGFVLLAVAACSGGHHDSRVSGSYATPGPPDDPWGPYVREASARFGVPETWVREVMRQESGGKQYLGGGLTTSSAGAMGLMQVMPATYDGLRQRYGLGDDPYDPHDNIMAGTAYIREMYDRFGAPNFLAAYNAGPRRVDDYLASGNPLPSETVNYVASIGPRIGGPASPQGSVAYAAAGASVPRYPVQVADAMQPIASPGDPGVPAPQLVARMEPIASAGDPGVGAPGVAPRMEPIASPGDPGIPPVVEAVARAPLGAPLTAVLARLRSAPTLPSRSPPPGILTLPAAVRSAGGPGGYGIQVGAYATPAEARGAAEAARAFLRAAEARSAVGRAAKPDGSVLFRARVLGLSQERATHACSELQASGRACFVVLPDGFS